MSGQLPHPPPTTLGIMSSMTMPSFGPAHLLPSLPVHVPCLSSSSAPRCAACPLSYPPPLPPPTHPPRLQEKFRLDFDDEQAVEWMQQLINESATALMPQIVETTHRWAQYWR